MEQVGRLVAWIVGIALSAALSWACTRFYYRRQVRQARLDEAAADSRHDQLMAEMLRVSATVRPDDLVRRARSVVTDSGAPVTADGEAVTVTDYEQLANAYETLGAPIMAGIVRKAGELDRYESMTLEDAYREGLIGPDPEDYR
jgi:hypothetical protein